MVAKGPVQHATASVTTFPTERSRALAVTRLQSIDILRGLVIVLMALDHVRDYFTGAKFNPLDLTQTDVALFLTRWITHFCAPVFVFLAGTSAYLRGRRSTPGELSRFLMTRGLWLIFLEVTVVRFVWSFNLSYESGLFLQVIWAIGASMLVLAALVRLPLPAIAAIGTILVAGHNLLDGIAPDRLGSWGPLWNLLHVQGPTPFGFVAYPMIPWIGVMALGYVLGKLYTIDEIRRRDTLIALGRAAIIVFLLLRLGNFYGDPSPWEPTRSATFTALSFLNVEKYPPSLLYLLATLGPALLLLGGLESARGRLAGILQTFGQVPLFFYILHIALAHLMAGLIGIALGFGLSVMTNFFVFLPKDWGFSLPVVYFAWLFVLVTLYPLCRWYAELKRRRRNWWLSYL